jgi:hypothetical protein
VYERLETPPVLLTFALLKRNGRFLATTGFKTEAGLSDGGRDKDVTLQRYVVQRHVTQFRIL